MDFLVVEDRSCGLVLDHLGLELFFLELVHLKAVLYKDASIVGGHHTFFHHDEHMEGLVQQFFGFELNFFLIHLLTEVSSACLISWDKVDNQLATLLVLPDHRQSGWIIKHVG